MHLLSDPLIVVLAVLVLGLMVAMLLAARSGAAKDDGSRRSVPEPPSRQAVSMAPPEGEFDPTATRVYRQPPQRASGATSTRASSSVIAGAHLVGLVGRLKGRRFSIDSTCLVVGRSPTCDIVLDDDRVSSRHAWIGPVGGKIVVRDLRSTNGTFLNAQVNSSITEAELRPGDTLFFGGHLCDQFRFIVEPVSSTSPR